MLAPNTRILLVEDSPVMANQTVAVLKSMGYKNVTEARNGFMALQRLVDIRETKGEEFDLFILDWEMPKLTGIEFYQMIQTIPAWAGIPAIFLTSFNSVEHVFSAASAGVEHYIIKPATKELFQKKFAIISKRDLVKNLDDLLHSIPDSNRRK